MNIIFFDVKMCNYRKCWSASTYTPTTTNTNYYYYYKKKDTIIIIYRNVRKKGMHYLLINEINFQMTLIY